MNIDESALPEWLNPPPMPQWLIEQIRADLVAKAFEVMPVNMSTVVRGEMPEKPVAPVNQYDATKVAREQAFIRANFAESYTDLMLDNDNWYESTHIATMAEHFEEAEARESFRKMLADAKLLLDAAIGDEPRAQ